MLDLSTYMVKQQVGWAPLAAKYDIFDPNTNEKIGDAKEEPPGIVQVARFFMDKKVLPTKISFYEVGSTKALFYLDRGFTFLRAQVNVHDGEGKRIGYFKQKLLSIGGGFYVYDDKDQQLAEVKGDWKGWNFKFLTTDGQELGSVSKKWAGLAKEFFTSADNYVVALNEKAKSLPNGSMLLLAAGIAIDTVFKEKG
jgi:uncharacterized protein YxjI